MTRRPGPRRLAASISVTVLAASLVVGCATAEEQDFCAQYDDLVGAVEQLREKDVATTDVEELRAAADDVRAELDQFQAVSEGRLDDALTMLRDDIDAVRQSLVDAGDDARRAAQPLIEDARDNLRDAWSVVQDVAAVQCPAQG